MNAFTHQVEATIVMGDSTEMDMSYYFGLLNEIVNNIENEHGTQIDIKSVFRVEDDDC